MPLIIPIILICIGCFLIVTPLVSNPVTEYLYILAVILVGFIVYVPFVYFKFSIDRFGNHCFFSLAIYLNIY